MTLSCRALVELSAVQCCSMVGLSPEKFKCPSLSALNLYGCWRLEGPGLLAALAAAPALQALNLDGCGTLGYLHLPHNLALGSLSANGCRGLHSIQCSSTVLTHCRAASCPQLKEAILQSQQLQVLDVGNCSQLFRLQFPGLDQAEGAGGSAPGLVLYAGGCSALAPAVFHHAFVVNTTSQHQQAEPQTDVAE